MTRNIPSELLPRSKNILLPFVVTEEDREALLTDAFYLHDPLLYGIDRKGSPNVFASKLISRLLDYGCLSQGEHSLARLLLTARFYCGVDKHAEIDDLVSMSNMLCQSATSATKHTVNIPAVARDSVALQTIATPHAQRRPTIFISYCHGDKDFAGQLIDDLSAAGHACWIDTSSIKGGDEWIMTIAEGIINSYALVVIVTFEALQSKWVQKEILWAQQKKKLVIPVILEDVIHETRFFPLVDCQGVKVFDSDYATALTKLLGSLPSSASPDDEIPDTRTEQSAAGTQPAASAINRPRSVPRTLELDYLERLKLEELLNAEKYTPLGGTAQHRAEMRAIFEHKERRPFQLMSLDKARHLRQETTRFDNAVEKILSLRQAVLLGEPGGGKTTTIWKLASDLVETALQAHKAPIPLLIRLGRWTDAEQSLQDFIASQLGEMGAYLDVLLQEKRAALLLDGLNELPASQHASKYPQVQQFIEQHPALLAVVSCRELDYTIDLGFDLINIMPLDPIRIREFAVRYLESEKGEALFWRLSGGDEVRALWEVWQRAGASFDLFWTATDIPRENPNVYGVTSTEQDRVWQEKVRGKHSLMELARNPYMLLMLTSIYAGPGELPENRGELFQLFVETLLKRERIPADEQAPLTEGLTRIAYEMQIRRANDNSGDALTVLPKAEAQKILGERLLYLAGSASILSLGEQVRFTHQLLQEYFAARYMDIEFRAGRLKAVKIWPPNRWWERTNWEEAAILLAGLYSDDCSPVVEWVAEANPEVAAQCVARGGAALAEATRERLRSKWIPRLTDLKHDPKPHARAAIGRALGLNGWDNRKGVGIVRDASGVALPDIDLVEIPGGEFQYGHKDESDNPPQKLTLPTFHISRYPVTFAQFRTFLDDPEGFADPRWFDGLAAKEDERGMGEQAFKFANHPRETVNWYQAMAFCRWLSWRRGGEYDLKKVAKWAVRLPTEFEWEKAARGSEGRIYPYKGDYDASKGNTSDTGIGQTCAVGIFPNGASPYGVMDMSGNVWEWCLSDYNKPAIDVRKENVRTENYRVLRGGSWFVDHFFARAVYRLNLHPAARPDLIGFRVVVVLRPPSLL
jgi:formylglycine-generating enzyme required for sulfatase activity